MTTEQSSTTLSLEEFLAKAAELFDQASSDASHDQEVQIEYAGVTYTVSIHTQSQAVTNRGGRLPDSFYELEGAATSAEPTDIGKHKHDYLAEAYLDLHDK